MPELLPQIAELLAAAAAEPLLRTDLSVAELRAACDAGVIDRLSLVRDVGPLHEVRDLTSPGGVPVRLYLPTQGSGDAGQPLHIHLHGGGWWMGSIATVDPMCRELAVGLGMAVLSVDYRLAPEHPWPAGLDDAYEVVSWMAEAFGSVSLGGESAGANLAAVVGLLARDRSGPAIVAQWLDVPAVDLRLPEDESVRLYGTGYGLELAQLGMIAGFYGGDPSHPHVSPIEADLTGLPPTIVTTAEFDPLRDQGAAYARRLAEAGVEVEHRVSPGHIHGSSWFTGIDDGTAAWLADVMHVLAQQHALASTS